MYKTKLYWLSLLYKKSRRLSTLINLDLLLFDKHQSFLRVLTIIVACLQYGNFPITSRVCLRSMAENFRLSSCLKQSTVKHMKFPSHIQDFGSLSVNINRVNQIL